MTRILHIASENYAGVPFSLVRAERMIGLDSEMLTILNTGTGHPVGQSLGLPFAKGHLVGLLRHFTGSTAPFSNTRYSGDMNPPIWQPKRGRFLFRIRDALWSIALKAKKIPQMLDKYDIIVLDGGIGFLRSGKYVLNWAARNEKLVSIFYGDDLRRRGAIQKIDEASKLIFTFEFDHTLIHPRAKFLFYPFFADEMPERNIINDGKIRIGHSPTKRASKGTDAIIAVLSQIREKHQNVEIVLIERMPYKDALRKKSKLDIFIDQLGELGYGISGLEALAMGIPTVVQLMPDFKKALGETPFICADASSLYDEIEKLISNPQMREEIGEAGKEWCHKKHDPVKVANTIFEQYKKQGWV